MPLKKRLFLLILLALFIDDICRYINFFIYKHPTNIESFDLVMISFNTGTIFNYSIIFVIVVSVIYFLLNFFSTDKN